MKKLTLVVLVALVAISCDSQSSLRAKRIAEVSNTVILRIPIKDVQVYIQVNGEISAVSYRTDTSIVELKGITTQVQDTIYVNKITSIKKVDK